MSDRPSGSHHLQLHLLVLLLAITAIFGKMLSVSALTLVWWRTALAAPAALLLAALWFGKPTLLPPGQVARLLGVGAIIGLHWACFFGAIKLANISICLAGMATLAFFTAFTEPLFDRRRVKGSEAALGLVVVAGICLIAGYERGNWQGLAVALLGAFLAAVFPVFNRQLVLRQRMDPLVMVGWEMVGAMLVCTVLLPVFNGPGAYRELLQLKGLDFLWLLLLAWVCTVFAHAFHIHLLRHLSAFTGNLAMNFEPVYGIIIAALLFGEHHTLHPGFYAGAATIILANIAHPLLLRRKFAVT